MELDATVLNSLLQATNWGILTTDADLTVASVNGWFETNCGRAAREIVGRKLLDVFPEVAARFLDDRYRQVLTGSTAILSQRLHGYLFSMPSSVERGRATQMQQSVRIVPLLSAGQVVGTLTVVEDVTERVELETSLRISAVQHATIADLAQQALAGTDAVTLLDRLAATVSGAVRAPYCGIFELVPGTRSLLLRAGSGWPDGAMNSTAIDTGPQSFGAEIIASSGPHIYKHPSTAASTPVPEFFNPAGIVWAAHIPVRSGAGCFGVIGIYSDRPKGLQREEIHFIEATANILGSTVERMRLEETLRQRAEQLATADQRKNEFLAVLAHELRNPLAPIESAIQILRLKGSQDGEVQWARDVIERQIQQMTRLVNDLLDVSRITTGKISLQTETVELRQIVNAAAEISRPVIEAHRHDFTIALGQKPVWMKADPPRLVQALANILNNAAKYTPDGGRITVKGAVEAHEVVIRVRDTGVGISAAMLPRIFDLFTQVDQSLERAEGGLGIGLTLVRQVMEMHGGSVHAMSEGTNCGSEFILRLPAATVPTPAVIGAGTGANDAAAMTSRKILVVDDNVDSANSLALLLKMMGSRTATAFSGSEALQAILNDPPDLAFLDIGLPGMNGHEVARRVRKDERLDACYLIALSGYGQAADIQASAEAGFDHHLVKPVTLENLMALLNRLPLARNSTK